MAALSFGVVAGNTATGNAAASSAVQASGKEFRIMLSRAQVKPGKLRVEFVNFGEDDHDLAIKRKGSSRATTFEVVAPGERAVKSIKTKRGTYVFWCTISDHKAKGMRAVLKVQS